MNEIKFLVLKIYVAFIFVITYYVYFEITYIGFPDGHKTEFEQAIEWPLTICNWINLEFGIFLLLLGYFKRNLTLRQLLFMIIIHFTCLVAASYLFGYHFKYEMGLEHGQGG